MPKKPPKAPPSLGNPGEPEENNLSASERELRRQEENIQSLLRSEGINGATAVVKRKLIHEPDYCHLSEIEAAGFSEEKIKNLYGGGEYKISFRSVAGVILGQARFRIDSTIPPKYPGVKPEEKKPDASMDVSKIVDSVVAAIASQKPAAAQDNSLLVELMKQNGEMARAAMTKPAGPDPMVLMMMESQKAMLAELKDLKAAKAEGGGSVMSKIKEIQAIQELLGGGGGGGDDDDDSPRPHKKTAMETILETLGPLAAAYMQSRGIVAAGADPAQVAQNVTPMAGQPTPPAAAGQPSDPMSPLFAVYKIQFRTLALKAAANKRDAFAWVSGKLDDIPENVHATVYQLANGDDWFDQIFSGAPEATQHITWLTTMRMAVLTQWLKSELITACRLDPRPEPAAVAKTFLDKVTVDFDDTLWDLVSVDDVTNSEWGDLFDGTGVDEVWLEQVRKTIDDEMTDEDGDDEQRPGPSPTPTHPTPGSSPGESAAPAAPAAPAAAANPPARKRNTGGQKKPITGNAPQT